MHKELKQQIDTHLNFLKLKHMGLVYESLSKKAAESKLGYDEYLALLLDEEVSKKQERSRERRISKAKFPFGKSIEQFDFSFQPSLNEKEVIHLSGLDFITQKHNIILLGPPGVGKTHLAVAFAVKACFARLRVEFKSTQDLIADLSLAEKEGHLLERLLFYSRLHLLVIDELGYMPISNQEANLLFQLISMRYEKGAIILTSNFNFDEWGRFFQDSVVAAAIIDRLVHHAHVFFINGSSYRIKNKIKKATST